VSEEPAEEELSPDRRTRVRWVVSDGRMSHVIRTPTILDAASGQPILELGDSGFDAEIVWDEDGGFEIDLRHYWRPGNLRVHVDRAAGTFRAMGPEPGEPQPLVALSVFVEDYFKAAARGAAGAERPSPAGKPRLLWAMLAIGLLLVLVLSLRR
jgi:hypothetical protein